MPLFYVMLLFGCLQVTEDGCQGASSGALVAIDSMRERESFGDEAMRWQPRSYTLDLLDRQAMTHGGTGMMATFPWR